MLCFYISFMFKIFFRAFSSSVLYIFRHYGNGVRVHLVAADPVSSDSLVFYICSLQTGHYAAGFAKRTLASTTVAPSHVCQPRRLSDPTVLVPVSLDAQHSTTEAATNPTGLSSFISATC